MVSLHSGTPLGVGTSHGHFGPQDTSWPGLGGSHHLPHIVFSAPHFGDYIQMALFPGTPKLESRNCPETVPGGVPGLWALITPDCQVWSQRSLNQTCSPRRDLSNAMSHSPFGGWEKVDSRLLVVGSQTANLTPGPSFAHNLGDRCSNGQYEAIFDIYASRTFQWHQEHLNARCFGPCCRTLNIRESRRTPSPQLWECWDSPLHLAKVGLRHIQYWMKHVHFQFTFPFKHVIVTNYSRICDYNSYMYITPKCNFSSFCVSLDFRWIWAFLPWWSSSPR